MFSQVVNVGNDENGNYIIISPELNWYYGKLIVNEWLPCRNITLLDLNLECNYMSNGSNGMIEITHTENSIIQNCKIKGINVMVRLLNCQNVTVKNCWFNVSVDDYTDPDYYKNNVMKFVGSLFCTVEGCHFSGSAQCVDVTYSYQGPFSYGNVIRDNYMFGSRNTYTSHPGTAACTIQGNRMTTLMNGISIRG